MRIICVLWLWMFLSEFKSSSTTEIQGHTGKSIKIFCSHTWARDNRKYFCRHPCKDEKNTLVRSDQSPNGRYTLEDYGNEFTVTITDLQESDSGIYYCAVYRSIKDTHNEVKLKITKDILEEVTHARTTETQTSPRINAEMHTTSQKHSTFRSLAITENTPTSTGFVTTSHPADGKTVPVHFLLYASAGLAIVLIICAVGLVAVCQRRKRVKKSRRSVARSICNERQSMEESAVYENRPEDRLYATMKKHRSESEEDSQSDPVYQNLNTTQTEGESIYGNLY